MDHIALARTGEPFTLGLFGVGLMAAPKVVAKLGTLAGAHPALAVGGAANGAYGTGQFLKPHLQPLRDKLHQGLLDRIPKNWHRKFSAREPQNGEYV